MKDKRITLLGATGYTGSIIALMLNEMKKEFTIAGRDPVKLMALSRDLSGNIKIIRVDVQDKNEVKALIDETDILINCAGPYNLLGNIILEEAARHNIVYMDISGEQEYIKNSLEKIDTIALEHGSSIIHALAFESCLVDLLASRIINKNKVYRDISSFYYFEKSRPSPGTRLCMKLNRIYPRYIFENSKLKNTSHSQHNKCIRNNLLPFHSNALFTPLPEVIFLPLKYNVRNCGSYLLMSDVEFITAKSGFDHTPQPLGEILNEHKTRNIKGPSNNERNLQSFILILNVIDQSDIQQNIMLSGTDMYGITAKIITNAVNEISEIKDLKTGVNSPCEIFKDNRFLDAIIEKANLKLSENISFSEILN